MYQKAIVRGYGYGQNKIDGLWASGYDVGYTYYLFADLLGNQINRKCYNSGAR